MSIKTFRDLIAWQKSMALAKAIYLVTRALPDTERFGLMTQMRRAAVSIPSNIAEGHGRQSTTEYIRYLKVARASLMELQTQVILAVDLELIQPIRTLDEILAETDRVLQGLIRSMQDRAE